MNELDQLLEDIDKVQDPRVARLRIKIFVHEVFSKALHESNYPEEVGDNFLKIVREL